MEESNEQPKRKGLHKFLHVSKLDTYVYTLFSASFFALLIFKVINRWFSLDMSTRYITWMDTMQIAVLWGILALVSHSYYLKHEKKYDN